MTAVFRRGIAIAWLFGVVTGVTLVGARDEPRVQLADRQTAESRDLDVIQLRPNFFMIAGAGANIGVQVGEDGVVVVDAGLAARADAVVAAIKKVTSRPIRY